MWLLLLGGFASAEINVADTLEWNATMSDLIVVGRVDGRESGVDRARVQLSVEQVVEGTWEGEQRLDVELAGDLTQVAAGGRVLLYLDRDTRRSERSLSLIDAQQGWLSLDHLDERGAYTATCGALATEPEVLGAVHAAWDRAGADAVLAPPADLQRSVRVPDPSQRWVACHEGDAYRQLNWGSTVYVRAPALGRPPGPQPDPRTLATALEVWPTDRHLFGITRATPELEWFRIGYVQAEAAACDVGVPDRGEPIIGACWFPGGVGEDPDVPRGLSAVAGRARRALARHLRAQQSDPVSGMRASHLGRGRAVVLEEMLPTSHLPRGRWRDGLHWQARLLLVGDRVQILDASGNGKPEPRCIADSTCNEPMHWLRWRVPSDRSVGVVLDYLTRRRAPDDPLQLGLVAAIRQGLAELDAGTAPPGLDQLQ